LPSRPLDKLSPEGRAVLSLVLLQSRSYGDIAALLRLGEADVRQRAHAAAGQLVPADGGPGWETRARIIDYMLGEQTVSARAQTRSELESSDVGRKWAAQLADALAPLAKSPLPSIPGPPAPPAPKPGPANPANRAESPARAAPAVQRAAGKPAAAPEPIPPAKPPQHVPRNAQRPISLVTPDFAGPRRRPVSRERLAIAAGIALIAIIALVIVLATSGGGSKPSTTAAPPRPPATPTTSTGRAARTIEKLVLQATGSNHNAFGAGAVIRQKDGSLLLLVQARGLTPNSQHNAYAVWLVNTPADARLLGFVKPAVGASGTFSSGTTLPSDAFRFHSLVVTIERSSQPTSPGPAVLRSPLSLP
jgi:hypothetical protein